MVSTTALTGVIQRSPLLSDAEREYWIANIGRMTPEQIARLLRILERAAKLPWTQTLENAVTAITRVAAVSPA